MRSAILLMPLFLFACGGDGSGDADCSVTLADLSGLEESEFPKSADFLSGTWDETTKRITFAMNGAASATRGGQIKLILNGDFATGSMFTIGAGAGEFEYLDAARGGSRGGSGNRRWVADGGAVTLDSVMDRDVTYTIAGATMKPAAPTEGSFTLGMSCKGQVF